MTWKTFFSPSLKIAGMNALLWGMAGLAVCVVCASFSGWHPNGLLQFGPATHDALWLTVLEFLIIWLVPAAIFYALGAALSSSRVRAIDVFGTTAFALLPLVAMNLWQLLPAVKGLLKPLTDLGAVGADLAAVDPADFIREAMALMMQPVFIVNTIIAIAVIVLMVVWLFNAVKVSCNLRGGRLGGVYLAGLIGGDILCRLLIGLLR